MPKIMGVNVAGILGGTLGATAPNATLTRVEPGTRTAGEASSGTNPTTTTFSCRAYMAEYKDDVIDGETIETGDRKICIYSTTLRDNDGDLVRPRVDDLIEIAEEDGETAEYRIVRVGRGTANARYVVQGRA